VNSEVLSIHSLPRRHTEREREGGGRDRRERALGVMSPPSSSRVARAPWNDATYREIMTTGLNSVHLDTLWRLVRAQTRT
jgi:hypothetical protein